MARRIGTPNILGRSGWRSRVLLRPATVLAVVLGLQLIMCTCFEAGLLRTLRLQAKPIPISGVIHLVAFSFIAVGMMALLERLKGPKIAVYPRWKRLGQSVLPAVTIGVLLATGIYGLLSVLRELPRQPAISQYVVLGIQGYFRSMIPWGHGLTILHVTLQVAVILSMLFIRKRRWRLLSIAISLGALAGYSVIYMSRIMLAAPLVAALMLMIRKKYYSGPVPRQTIFISVTALFALIVLQQGFRDYGTMGQQYTGSPLLWGLSRIAEYYVSTGLFSAYIGSMETMSTYSAVGSYFGTPEYVNVGSLGQLFSSFGIAYLFVLLGFWWIVSRYWRSFDKGYTDGLILFPFMFYSLLETSRIFEFTTVTGVVRLGLLMVCGWLFRNISPRG